MPVQARFFDHQVVASFGKITPYVLDKHDNIDNHPRKHMETMESGYRKKEVGEIGRSLRAVGVYERISSPPGAFSV